MTRAGLTAGLLVAVWTGAAVAGPVDDLRDAEGWFTYGDFDRVIEKLKPLVEPKSLLPDRDDLARSYELLGLACFYQRREVEARKYFERLVRLEPDKHLDPLLVPPPAVQFYEDVRASLAEELARQKAALEKQLAEEDERRRRANTVVEKIELRRNSRFVAAMPLGAGQLQDGQYVTGGLLLGTQLVLAGLSIGFAQGVEGLRQPSGRYAPSDVERAEAYQAAQLGCGYGALLIALGGILHAQLTFRENTEINREFSAPGVRPDLGPPATVEPTGAVFRFFGP